MPRTKPKLTFFGSDAFAVPTLERLHTGGYELTVITKPDGRAGRGRTVTGSAIKQAADRLGLHVITPTADELYELKIASQIGIVVAYGHLIPETLIKRLDVGILNIHGSLLPAYRGPSPIEAALVNGDERTGITIMQIDAGMDTGPIYTQREYPLHGSETRPQLYTELAELGANTLAETLPSIIDGTLKPIPQDDRHASMVGMISKSDGIINWLKPAARVEREIRGYLGWPGSRTELFGHQVTITAARVAPGSGKPGSVMRSNDTSRPLFVYCGEDALVIDRLIPAGKREMSAADFLRGIKQD